MKVRIPKIPGLTATRPHQTPESSPIPKAYRPWVMLSLGVLVCSLFALTVIATVAFVYYANVLTPLWLTVLGALAAAGVAAGFGGFFLLLLVGAYTSFKEDRKGQLPPPSVKS